MSSRSPRFGLRPQNAPEPVHGQPDPAGHHGTTPSADPPARPWLFQKGNTYGRLPKRHKGPMEKYIQKQTMSRSMIVAFWLGVASAQPFRIKRIVYLPLTREQWAVARGTATPEQRKIAKKQPRFIVVTRPYYPTPKDVMEAVHWLTEREFGKPKQTVPIHGSQTEGIPIEFRPWPPGLDPRSHGDRVSDEQAKDVPRDSSKDERIVGGPRHHPPRDP